MSGYRGDRPTFYIMGPGHIPIPVTPDKWKPPAMDDSHIVAKTMVAEGVEVSTVFLGMDHNYWGEGPPVLFETMIFDDYEEGNQQWRWCTWDEAMQGHEAACELIRVRIAIANGITTRGTVG